MIELNIIVMHVEIYHVENVQINLQKYLNLILINTLECVRFATLDRYAYIAHDDDDSMMFYIESSYSYSISISTSLHSIYNLSMLLSTE